MSKAFEARGARAQTTILFVDDEADLRELVELTVARMGHSICSAASLAEARSLLAAHDFQFCLTDMRLPDGDGLTLLRELSTHHPEVPVAVLTAHGNTENAVAALKSGAFDYLSKPLALDDLRGLIRSALRLSVAARASPVEVASRLLGDSPPMVRVRALIARISKSQAPVYLTGESGSGKELAARLLHEGSARQERAFVPVNCGAIPENLMESEFFGYRKGAFTGASEDRDGFFHAADGGTLFLDEVADLPLSMQVKLLRVIQEKRVRKVGATSEDPIDVRVICATHQNLSALVESGRFRQDLYYRLAVIELRMPALRECSADVPMIARSLLGRIAAAAGHGGVELTAQAEAALAAHDFPGNVRELENILERAVALSGSSVIDVPDLMLAPVETDRPVAERVGAAGGLGDPSGSAADVSPGTDADVALDLHESGHGSGEERSAAGEGLSGVVPLSEPLPDYLDRLEREAIMAALGQTGFNRTRAAQVLGITFRALRYRMNRLGIREDA
jgi:two-component system response regulator PilR (NtrC family)